MATCESVRLSLNTVAIIEGYQGLAPVGNSIAKQLAAGS